MKKILLIAIALLIGNSAFAQTKPLKVSVVSEAYVITAHTVVYDADANSYLDNYVIVHGSEILKVQYFDSQISTVNPEAPLLEQMTPANLHHHQRYGRWPQEPNVSQVPRLGVPIRACEMSKYTTHDGSPVIAVQSVPAPCMHSDGRTLHYIIAPNEGLKNLSYVNFDILSETLAGGAR